MTVSLNISEIDNLSCSNCAARHSWQLQGSPSQRASSIVASASCRACGERVFLKKLLTRDGEEAASRAQQEFAAASNFHGLSSGPSGAAVPRPVGRFGDLLIYEYVEGHTLGDVLHLGGRLQQRAAMSKAGSWFANFHRVGFRWFGAADLSEKYNATAARLAAQRKLPALAYQALEYLDHGARTLAERTYRLVVLHGDAKPANLVLSGGLVFGLDIDGRFVNVGEMDMAQFLVQSEIAAANMLGSLDQDAASDLEQAFLDGYAQSGTWDPEVLNWMKVYFSIGFWLSMRSRRPLRAYALNPMFRRTIENTMAKAGSTAPRSSWHGARGGAARHP